MKNWMFVLLWIMAAPYVKAQDTKYPRVVLVQLRAERNRINALTARNQVRQAEELKAEAVQVQKLMVGDFVKNFRYCPVYYYMDTNLQYIMDGKFDGVLLNADQSVATNTGLHEHDTDYMIAFYGRPVVQSYRQKIVTDPDRYANNSGEPYGKGLIINNYKMQQLHYFYKLGYQNLWRNKRKMAKKSFYESDKYDMEYFPFAQSFNDLLKRHWQDRYREDPE